MSHPIWQDTPLDRLLMEVCRRLGTSKKSLLRTEYGFQYAHQMFKNNKDVPLSWYIKIYDLTGMSIEEQRYYTRSKPTHERDNNCPPYKEFTPN